MTENTASTGVDSTASVVRAHLNARRVGCAPTRKRNIDSLLEVAKAVFGTSGVDAPAKEIADLAGIGTLCRHFPHRRRLAVGR